MAAKRRRLPRPGAIVCPRPRRVIPALCQRIPNNQPACGGLLWLMPHSFGVAATRLARRPTTTPSERALHQLNTTANRQSISTRDAAQARVCSGVRADAGTLDPQKSAEMRLSNVADPRGGYF